MKKIFNYSILLFTCLTTFAQQKYTVTFQGEIANRNSDSLYIKDAEDETILKTFIVDKTGFFKDTINIKEGFYELHDGVEYTNIAKKLWEFLGLSY